MKVAVVTSQEAAGMSDDDPILLKALDAAGHQAHLCNWDSSAVWEDYDVALVRSTWDYFERAAEFQQWLTTTEPRVRFVNEVHTLQWNLDKHYLVELARAGLAVLPTQICHRPTLDAAIEALWETGHDAIIKPVVAGGSWGLHRLAPNERPCELDAAHAPWLVQPFVPSIQHEGELSVICLGGVVSHGIRKRPAPGDIRVQKEHGGQYEVEEPTPEAAALALKVLAACPGNPMYARADMVIRDGRYELMEMELLEPELFFAMVPEAADKLAALL